MTVTDVKMTPDLKIARVYVSVFGSPEQQAKAMKMLDDERRHIRGMVSSRVKLKFSPALEFFLDTTAEEADRIEKLIRKLHAGDSQTG
jgi:ribosome-binding factor A